MELKDLKNIAIHCETEEQAKLCCELADNLGWSWRSGRRYVDGTKDWYKCKGNTCYYFYKGIYSSLDFFKEINCTIKPASWFLENFKTKDNMEEKETKKGTLAEMYACANDELKKVLESKFSEEELGIGDGLPNTWEEFCEKYQNSKGEFYIGPSGGIYIYGANRKRDKDDDKNLLPSKQSAEAHLALMQLEQLRDCYRQGWLPNWGELTNKYVIIHYHNGFVGQNEKYHSSFLSFQTSELRDKFLNNFIDLIKVAKDLI